MGTLSLLPRECLVKTGPVDHADWNFSGVLGYIQRRRFEMIARLLGGNRHARLLELGYGSGIFMPELSRHCEALFGLDVHAFGAPVARVLREHAAPAKLLQGSAIALPYASDSMDAAVAVSCLEFIDPLDSAIQEVRRVLKPGGLFVAVTPGYSKLADTGLRLLTGESADADFGRRRQLVVPTLLKYFEVAARGYFPPIRPLPYHLYRGFALRKT